MIDKHEIVFDCAYCGKETVKQDDDTWACVNPLCWSSSIKVKDETAIGKLEDMH